MSTLRVVPIVEGHGEQASVRKLLTRLWLEHLGGQGIEVLRPIRRPRSQLVRQEELERAVNLAMLKLTESESTSPSLVLILIDADQDAPCLLGPELLRRAQKSRTDADIACVLANVEYETWFVAGAESLDRHLDLRGEQPPEAPEERRCGKSWIAQRIRAPKYTETIDQPSMTDALDLELCRRRSPSFDKLCRELASRLRP